MLLLLTALLIIGMTTPSMTAQAADTEGINQFVTRLYQVCFGREPDAGGLADWSNRLATGQETGAQVTYGFVFSQEFRNMNLCDSHYVDALYEAFFGRASDEAGKADWMNRLVSGQTRGAVMTGFVNSEEFYNLCASYGITQGTGDWSTADIAVNGSCVKDKPTEGIYNFVTRLYTTCLERSADAAGVEDWANRLAHGDTGSNVAYGFVSSEEYQNKKASNEQYVNMLYRTMLGREADAAGLTDWVGKLRNGAAREEVFNGFLQSTEFAGFCKEAGIVVGDPIPYTSVPVCNGGRHNFVGTTVTPTCTEKGYTLYTCLTCGYTSEEDYQPALGHSYNEKVVVPTCTEAGYVEHTCKVCGYQYTDNYQMALGHDMHDTVTQAPTCVRDGEITTACSRCGYSYTQSVSRTGEHQFATTTTEPDCINRGYTQYTCSICGYSYQNPTAEPLGHDYDTTVIREATCIMGGQVRHTCSRCGSSYTESTGSNGNNHNYVATVVAPTATERGYTQYKCAWCAQTYYTDYTEPVGHIKGAVLKVVSPSKEGPGYTVYDCTTCDEDIKADYIDFQPTEEQVYSDMMALQSQYPEGMSWTNANSYISQPLYSGGYGCHAFALILSDEAFGYLSGKQHTDFSNIRVGDILRINNNSHTVIILQVKSDSVIVAEGNYNSSIHWGREISMDTIKKTGDYVITRYPQ